MKVCTELNMLHPIMVDYVRLIDREIIRKHSVPIRLFETGRDHARHQIMIDKGKTKNVISKHLYNMDCDPPFYATAVSYVYFDSRYSWNLRDSTIFDWYKLFGSLVLDLCPGVKWGAEDRKSMNYSRFELSDKILLDNIEKFPCTIL